MEGGAQQVLDQASCSARVVQDMTSWFHEGRQCTDDLLTVLVGKIELGKVRIKIPEVPDVFIIPHDCLHQFLHRIEDLNLVCFQNVPSWPSHRGIESMDSRSTCFSTCGIPIRAHEGDS